jgi:hypothetical protein
VDGDSGRSESGTANELCHRVVFARFFADFSDFSDLSVLSYFSVFSVFSDLASSAR